MITVVYGASSSGKSEFAEEIIAKFPKPYKYIATMIPFDDEVIKRIEKHKKMRSEKGFSTIECPQNINDVNVSQEDSILIECMGNLVANEIFSSEDKKQVAEKIISEIKALEKRTASIVIVTNDVFNDGVIYSEQTKFYIKTLALINQELFNIAQNAYEVVFSIAVTLKGEKV